MVNRIKNRLSPGTVLLLIGLLAFGLRLAAALTRPMLQLDETIYARMAENLATGKGFVDLTGAPTAHFSPLFPSIIAGVSFILRNYAVSGYAVVIVFGSLIVIPTYLLGRELISERVGLMAAALSGGAAAVRRLFFASLRRERLCVLPDVGALFQLATAEETQSQMCGPDRHIAGAGISG